MLEQKNKIGSIRESYGKALAAYGEENENVVVLDADVSNSTFTKYFAEKHPKRFFNVGIAEAGMIDTAAGLALNGMVPFANSFAALICYRALEQIRTSVSYNNLNVKIVASYAGVSDFKDGPTHYSIFDNAIMRAMPNMTVVNTCDSIETEKMVKAVAEYKGPVYLRLSRADLPIIFGSDYQVKIGKGVLIKEGGDLTLISTGTMLYRVLKAAEAMKKNGINARVLQIHTLKPLDDEIIIKAAEETGAIVTIEEHSIIGGLFSATAELLVKKLFVPIKPIGINDSYACTSLDLESLLDKVGLSIENIINAAKEVIKNK